MNEVNTISPGKLLNIHKLILLLDNFHFLEFKKLLLTENASLSLQLIETIYQRKEETLTADFLTEIIYKKINKKTHQSFNQLAFYTFKLTTLLVRNYPSYLQTNIHKLHNLVNCGENIKANFLAQIALDIAEKIEDYTLQKAVLNFLAQQSFLLKEISEGNKFYDRLMKVNENEQIYLELYQTLRKNFNPFTRIDNAKVSIVHYKKYFQSFHEHESLPIKLISRYAYLYLIYYFEPNHFPSEEIKKLILETSTEIQNHGYVSLPFLFDIKSNLSFFKLNSNLTDLQSKEGEKEMNHLQEYYKSVKFWNSYLCIPEVFTLTVKVSHYISKYHYKFHRADQKQFLSEKETKDIENIYKRCDQLLDKKYGGSNYTSDLIHIQISKSVLLLFFGIDGAKKSTEALESLLTTYQQLSFTSSIDAIYVTLMCGYFTQKNYLKCNETFNRYTKLMKGKPIYEDNDITIHTYYYSAQWILNGRKQYAKKLEELFKKTLTNNLFDDGKKTITEFVNYYKIPVSMEL